MNFEHTDEVCDITISTHVPSKWRFVDLETGDIWEWKDGKFQRAGWDDIEALGPIWSNIPE